MGLDFCHNSSVWVSSQFEIVFCHNFDWLALAQFLLFSFFFFLCILKYTSLVKFDGCFNLSFSVLSHLNFLRFCTILFFEVCHILIFLVFSQFNFLCLVPICVFEFFASFTKLVSYLICFYCIIYLITNNFLSQNHHNFIAIFCQQSLFITIVLLKCYVLLHYKLIFALDKFYYRFQI